MLFIFFLLINRRFIENDLNCLTAFLVSSAISLWPLLVSVAWPCIPCASLGEPRHPCGRHPFFFHLTSWLQTQRNLQPWVPSQMSSHGSVISTWLHHKLYYKNSVSLERSFPYILQICPATFSPSPMVLKRDVYTPCLPFLAFYSLPVLGGIVVTYISILLWAMSLSVQQSAKTRKVSTVHIPWSIWKPVCL